MTEAERRLADAGAAWAKADAALLVAYELASLRGTKVGTAHRRAVASAWRALANASYAVHRERAQEG